MGLNTVDPPQVCVPHTQIHTKVLGKFSMCLKGFKCVHQCSTSCTESLNTAHIIVNINIRQLYILCMQTMDMTTNFIHVYSVFILLFPT